MLGRRQTWLRELVPVRHIGIPSRKGVRYVTLSSGSQIALVGVLCCGLAFAAGLSLGVIPLGLSSDDAGGAVSADELKTRLAQVQERLEATTRDLEQARARLSETEAQGETLRGQLDTSENRLRDLAQTRQQAVAERERIQQQLKSAESALGNKGALVERLTQNLDNAKAELRRLDQQRAELSGKLHELQSRVAVVKPPGRFLAEREAPQAKAPDQQVASVRSPEVAPSLSGKGRSGWAELSQLLASAGVDVDHLLVRFGAVAPGQGGPFVAMGSAKPGGMSQGAAPVNAEGMQKLLKTLPLTAPMSSYQIESHFGARIDPFNGHRAFHAGLDLSSAFGAPVFATAPGRVVYAGPKGDFGRVVEIDHGSGIITRYAHLHRIMANIGQHVGEHQRIGLLGSTGRSSGPHVHYEVIVNGNSLDPEKFLAAGKGMAVSSR